MTGVSDDTACRITAGALQLAISLDSFTTFDWAEKIGPAVQQGNQKLKELERRQESLTVSLADAATLGWLIEVINVRLNFLERLNDQILPVTAKRKRRSQSG